MHVPRTPARPIFSGGGLPHDRLAVEIARHARLRQGLDGGAGDDFAIVFAGIGVPYDSAEFFRKSLEQSGALERTALFLNLASDSSTQRLPTPRFALTAAEYLAFVEGKHVLVIMTDMTNYAEALREVFSSKGEIPSRKGFPGYMYSDLASLFERAGCIHGAKGTLTQLSILTMPAGDIGHPIPDLTGYLAEGQIVLSRELDRRAIYPPINVLPSLSRLMKDGTSGKYTHPDRAFVTAHDAALAALQGTLARHGLDELQIYPAPDQSTATIERIARSIMGVRLQDAGWQAADATAPPSVAPSPEAEACRRAFLTLVAAAVPLAAVSGNLERLSFEYRRSVRRARALQDVLLPELGNEVYGIETRLEELEQEDAIAMRYRP